MKLLIVDDEKYIRLSLKNGYDWQSLGFDEVFDAGNVKNAFEIIKTNKISVLITDIKMPNTLGTKLIENTSQISPDTKIIVISGYDEFEYAQLALKNGVVDYLLKPVSVETIAESVKKAVDMTLNSANNKYKRVVIRDFFNNIFLRRITDVNEIEDGIREYGIEFLYKKFLLILFTNEKNVDSRYTDTNMLNDIRNYFEGFQKNILFRGNNGQITMLMEDCDRNFIYEKFNDCCKFISEKYNYPDFSAYVCNQDDCMHLADTYENVIENIKRFTLNGEDRVVFVDDIENTKAHNIINMAKKYVDEHLAENITIDDVADIIYISPNYFSTIFKRDTGIGFVQYINQRRMDVAKKLLESYDMPVSEIAENVGFEVKYFNRVFKKYVGMTPSEYRKSKNERR